MVTIGNPIGSGNVIQNATGSYILYDYDLPDGDVIRFHLTAGVAMGNVVLQIWRPVLGDDFLLLHEFNYTTLAGRQTVRH